MTFFSSATRSTRFDDKALALYINVLTSTKEALMEVCDIIVAVRGHPKMQNLGEDIKCRLHTGKSVVY